MMFQVNDGGQWHNRYCGPGAVSLLTGVTTNEVARAVKLRFRNWDSRVRGMHDHELKWALRHFGREVLTSRCFWNHTPGKPKPKTLGNFLERLIPRPGVAYVIIAGNHYQTYLPFLGEIRDNWGEWPVEDFPYTKRWFSSHIEVDCTRWTNDRRKHYGG